MSHYCLLPHYVKHIINDQKIFGAFFCQRAERTRKRCGANVIAFHFISGEEECRQLEYSQPVQDRALTNHVIIKINTTRKDTCIVKCFIEPKCLSFNVGPLDNHQYLCEISDSDDVLYPGHLVQRMGFTYKGTQVCLEFGQEYCCFPFF